MGKLWKLNKKNMKNVKLTDKQVSLVYMALKFHKRKANADLPSLQNNSDYERIIRKIIK
jgi:hypothetical protein